MNRDEWVEKYLGNATERVQLRTILEHIGMKYDARRNMWQKPMRMANGRFSCEDMCMYVDK
jgi:hypothetical protein